MIDKPDTETAVFIRLLRDTVVEGRGRDADDQMEGRAGEVVVIRIEVVGETHTRLRYRNYLDKIKLQGLTGPQELGGTIASLVKDYSPPGQFIYCALDRYD
jgi:hypothetical protein